MAEPDVQVAIVGGGLAGLFTAVELIRRGIEDIVVFDRSIQPGGLARTIHRDGYALEPAAGTLLLPHPHLTPLLDAGGVEVVPAEAEAALRYIYTRDRLIAVPSSPQALFAPLVPFTAKLRGALEPFVRTEPESADETLDSFLRRRFGDRLGGMLAWVAASGVFAGDPKRLSIGASFPLLPALEAEGGSLVRGGLRRLRNRGSGGSRPVSHLPVGGMSGLAGTVAESLGDRFRGGFEVTTTSRDRSGWKLEGAEAITAGHVVLAVDPRAGSELVSGELSEALTGSVTAPVVVVGLGGLAPSVPMPSGFGVLTGPDPVLVTRGILFESSYAPDRAPEGHGLMKVVAGGAVRPEVGDWDDDRIIETVVIDAARILGDEVSPEFVEVARHVPGIPQYEIGHLEWLGSIDRLVGEEPGLHLTGWGYRGVGVAHLATDAVRVATEIAADRQAT